MISIECQNCGMSFEIEENNTSNGKKNNIDVICPNCDEILTTIKTNGIPSITAVVNKNEFRSILDILGFGIDD